MIRALYTVARIALAVVFIRSGLRGGLARSPAEGCCHRGAAAWAVRSQSPVPLPEDEQLVQANAAAQVAGGVLLRDRHPTAAGGRGPDGVTGADDACRALVLEARVDLENSINQRNHFNKNIGLFGGLLPVMLTGSKAGPKLLR